MKKIDYILVGLYALTMLIFLVIMSHQNILAKEHKDYYTDLFEAPEVKAIVVVDYEREIEIIHTNAELLTRKDWNYNGMVTETGATMRIDNDTMYISSTKRGPFYSWKSTLWVRSDIPVEIINSPKATLSVEEPPSPEQEQEASENVQQ